MTVIRVRSIVVNGLHLWECDGCGRRWNPEDTDLAMTHEESASCEREKTDHACIASQDLK